MAVSGWCEVIAGSLDDDFLGLFDRRVAIRLILVRRRGAAHDFVACASGRGTTPRITGRIVGRSS
jgi:hypothetical protein